MGNFNQVILLGNLTRDPEQKFIASGDCLCNLGIAVNKEWTGQDGQKKSKVCFVDVTFWKRQAEVITQYFNKGDPIFIVGELELDQWTDQTSGQKRSKLKVKGHTFQFVKSKSDNQEQGGGGYQRPQGQQQGNYQQPGLPTGQSQLYGESAGQHGDVPF